MSNRHGHAPGIDIERGGAMNSGPLVVGIDGTPADERALRWAMDEAT
jgi:hypothetical protein